MIGISKKIRALVARIRGDQEGVAAVEFAIVLPILALLFLGTFETGQALTVDRRVTQAASSVADIIAQGDTINDAGLANVVTLAETIMRPYDGNALDVTIISVIADADGNTTVGWSYKKGGGEPYSPGDSYTMDGDVANLMTPTSSVIIAETKFNYVPAIGMLLKSGIELSETFYLRPRKSLFVTKE